MVEIVGSARMVAPKMIDYAAICEGQGIEWFQAKKLVVVGQGFVEGSPLRVSPGSLQIGMREVRVDLNRFAQVGNCMTEGVCMGMCSPADQIGWCHLGIERDRLGAIGDRAGVIFNPIVSKRG